MRDDIKIKRAINRTEKAYELYQNQKTYLSALRIFKANRILYQLLEGYWFEREEDVVDEIVDFLFHLEDWFEQFAIAEMGHPKLESPFSFKRIEGALPYPSQFVRILN